MTISSIKVQQSGEKGEWTFNLTVTVEQMQKAKQTCKPSSVLRLVGAVTIYLALMLPSGSSDLPGTGQASLSPSVWSCSGWGLPSRLVSQPLVSSYLTISPLPFLGRAVCFCGTVRRVTPPGHYPASCPVELGLSSHRRRAATRFT